MITECDNIVKDSRLTPGDCCRLFWQICHKTQLRYLLILKEKDEINGYFETR